MLICLSAQVKGGQRMFGDDVKPERSRMVSFSPIDARRLVASIIGVNVNFTYFWLMLPDLLFPPFNSIKQSAIGFCWDCLLSLPLPLRLFGLQSCNWCCFHFVFVLLLTLTYLPRPAQSSLLWLFELVFVCVCVSVYTCTTGVSDLPEEEAFSRTQLMMGDHLPPPVGFRDGE